MKTSSSGIKKWSKTFGGEDADWAYSVIQTSDGGYALAGFTSSYGAGEEDFWLVKTDSSGNEEWSKTFGGGNKDEAYSIIQAPDGGYVLAGKTRSYGAGVDDCWLIKTDSSGNVEGLPSDGDTNGGVGGGIPIIYLAVGAVVGVIVILTLILYKRSRGKPEEAWG